MIDLNKTFEPANHKIQLRIAIFILLVLSASLCFLVVKAVYDPDVPFLRTNSRANWILYHLIPETYVKTGIFINLTTEFTKDFELTSVPSNVRLYVRGFKTYDLWINNELLHSSKTERNWKKTNVLEISRLLKEGANTIKVQVTCKYGPAALWLYTEGLQNDIKTDVTWMASISGSPAFAAGLANDCFIHPVSLEAVRPLNAMAKKLPMLILFFVLSSTVFWLHNYKQKKAKLDSLPALRFLMFTPKSVLIISIILWTILFINNVSGRMPLELGFDAPDHIEYVRYLLKHHSIPLADYGWETYQPPFFYVLSSLILSFAGLISYGENAYFSLKLIPFLCGVGQIYLAYLTARILFSNSKTIQAVSVAVAALIPMNIYISHYFSNESLCAFLMGLSILITIIILNGDRSSSRQFGLLGLVMGLALLTKFTGLTILPVISLMLLYKLLSDEKCPLSTLARHFGLMFVLIAVIAGWFYIRNWVHFGKVFVGNWDASAGFHWWQDPGYHTCRYFCRFGKVFSLPYFAGSYSLFDSLYSTFWGDSQLGGIAIYTHRPPWNYEYMSTVYLLAIPATLVIVIGALRAAGKAILYASKSWLLILFSIFAIIYSIVYINLRLPYYGQAKAFYGLAAMLPISLIFALGFNTLDKWLKNKKLLFLRTALYGWFGTLALTVFFSLLVRAAQMQAPPDLLALAKQGKLNYAITHYTQLLHNDPGDRNSHYELATAYALQRKYNKAIEHYRKAVQLRSDWPEALTNLAVVLANKPDASHSERVQAIQYAERCCQLTGYLQVKPLKVLAAAYAAADRFEDAIETAEKAMELAVSAGEKDLAAEIQNRLQSYRTGQPYHKK
jgi:hypothetical protein